MVWLPVVSSSHTAYTPYVHVLRDYSRPSILPEGSSGSFLFKNLFLNLINRYQKQFYKQTTYLRNVVTSITLRHKPQNGYTFCSLT